MNAAVAAGFIVLMIGCALMLILLMISAWRAERRSIQRIHEIEAEGRWLRTKNRAVTNKDTGQGWTGRHPRRR